MIVRPSLSKRCTAWPPSASSVTAYSSCAGFQLSVLASTPLLVCSTASFMPPSAGVAPRCRGPGSSATRRDQNFSASRGCNRERKPRTCAGNKAGQNGEGQGTQKATGRTMVQKTTLSMPAFSCIVVGDPADQKIGRPQPFNEELVLIAILDAGTRACSSPMSVSRCQHEGHSTSRAMLLQLLPAGKKHGRISSTNKSNETTGIS